MKCKLRIRHFQPPNSSVSVHNVHFMVCIPLKCGFSGFILLGGCVGDRGDCNPGGRHSKNPLGLLESLCFTTNWYCPAPQKQKTLGEVLFGSLHKFHVIHSASRNYTWKARISCVIHGVGHYIGKCRRGTPIYGPITQKSM